jgi:hypothetical protein
MPTETFWTLLRDSAHWQFEIFVNVVFDGVVMGLVRLTLWPIIKRHWQHHIDRDKREGVE